MVRFPAEVFGRPVNDSSRTAQVDRERHWCPFANEKCDKKSRLIDYPMGVCSVKYGNDVLALCAKRFLQDALIFRDIADDYFGSRDNLLLFREVGLRDVGNFDYVLVKHRPLSSEIEDFLAIELQAAQTTGTGNLVQALEDFMQGKTVMDTNYAFGLNMADIWKRAFTQVLNKGIVMERWGHKIYWVVQEPVYQDLLKRYHLRRMKYAEKDSTVFCVWDLKWESTGCDLFRTRVQSTNTGYLFRAMRRGSHIPSKDAFLEKLTQKIESRKALRLRLSEG